MSDLRTTQILAYMTHQPERYREVLGLPATSWWQQQRAEGERPSRLRRFAGQLLTRAGHWLLDRAAQTDEASPVSHTQQPA